MPRIVGGLHANPHSRAVSEQLAEPNRDDRRDRLALAQNVMEMLARNTEKLRDLRLGSAGRRNHVLPEQRTRMGRAAIGATLGDLRHDDSPQWYCSKSTRQASPSSNSKVMHHGPFTWTE